MFPLPSCPGMALLEVVELEGYCYMWPGTGMGMVEDTRNRIPQEVRCIPRTHDHDPNSCLGFIPFQVPPQILFVVLCSR